MLHDVAPVLYGIRWTLQEVSRKTAVELVHYFSDGARQHFKNQTVALVIVGHEILFGCRGRWHFHASQHGKSVYDGISAVLKRSVRTQSLKRNTWPTRMVDDITGWNTRSVRNETTDNFATK